MRHFAVIGHPLGHSLSPALHNHIFQRLSLDAHYEAWDTPPDGLIEITRQLRQGDLAGINITLPYKTAFIPHLDEVAPDAVPVGAVNCVVADGGKLIGHNTDLIGIQSALQRAGFQAESCSALLMGAGGAARAAMAALLALKADRIRVADLREADVASFLAHFRRQSGATTLEGDLLQPGLETAPFQLLINATPVGMWPQTEHALLHSDQLFPEQTVFDMVYHPEQTLLIQRALGRHCKVITGLDMFIAQGLASLEHWFPGVIYSEAGQLDPRVEISALRATLLAAIEEHTSSADTIPDTGENV